MIRRISTTRSVTSAPYWLAINKAVLFEGLTDFPTGRIDTSNQCPCGSVARVPAGLSAKCLLQASLVGDHLDERSFALQLDEADVPDRAGRFANYQLIDQMARAGMGVGYAARH